MPRCDFSAAFDSVDLLGAIVAGTSDIETAADKANSADCNYRHLEIMLEKSWFADTLTSSQRTDIDAAIVAGSTYWEANKDDA